MSQENLSWVEIHELIKTMRDNLNTQQTVTRTISRINYGEVLGILRNFTEFQHNRNIKLKIILQDGLMTIQMERKQ